MPLQAGPTKEKILHSALTLFSTMGIGNTSMNDIAYQAGVTRVTVYRYFPNKEELVQAAFLRVEQVFQDALVNIKTDPNPDMEIIFNSIGEGLSTLPTANEYSRFQELKRLYPNVYTSVQEIRNSELNDLFDCFFSLAEQKGILRAGLNRSLAQAAFLELTLNLFDRPAFKSVGLSGADLYRAMTNLFLYGVLKS
jgi:AcrR family transcriptional regulator